MAKTGYVGIGDIAHKIKSIYVGVNGVARKVKSAYIGVDGIARQWYASGTPISSLDVGTIVRTSVNNVLTDFIIVNQGIPQNSSLYDASCDGTWLLMKDCWKDDVRWQNGYISDVSVSIVQEDINNNFVPSLDTHVQNIIKQVKIPVKNEDDKVYSGANGMSCRAFSLGGYELGWTGNYFPEDGARLSYFENGTTTSANTKRIAYYNQIAVEWWTRSCETGNDFDDPNAYSVQVNGTYARSKIGNYYCIRPAFILPSDTLINPDTMEIIA